MRRSLRPSAVPSPSTRWPGLRRKASFLLLRAWEGSVYLVGGVGVRQNLIEAGHGLRIRQ
jgi:hypothetical protein